MSTPDDLGFDLKKKRRWPWIAGAAVVVVGVASAIAVPLLSPAVSANEQEGATLYVATAEGNASEQALVDFVAKEVAPRYGITVAFKGLSDSNTINRAVSEGEVAATVYQHKLWLGQVLEANPDFEEEAATPVFRWGFGLWSDKYSDVSQIPDGGTVSLYSDPANEAQGLWLLQNAGLITLKPGTEPGTATQDDIAENPKNLQFTLLDFAAQSRALPDLDAAVGYTEYYLAAGIPIEQQIFAPQAPDDFAGQLTIGSKYRDTENVKKLVQAFQDPAVQEFLATDETVKGILLPIDG
ncbi:MULTISPECIES: MetQ/NlpA family ABC transporter substrate-binding protein [unclassified Rathayibacter]|jgi:YaeC family lipoprotein|uniref:MetQ/NlpA family ABC transporter substrate-binding protein n=1 Tax=unclassified Rathayibacter TaxID=2609250 RepID=UPI000CE80729|nr:MULTISPECIES: MetQ/NlpA family ABC transporter substrate-binding protein [unclassified Rathayibacter]PPF28462.1 metal ABC transporter substrate-binding protein [Rathayibacter sp. AY1F2]PPF39372.1 metal ABC transporter substrate-binding protein [Rathayibacter sp. AY1A2]PPG60496.1 metal ABC transporter substrate-binding protein [Rathayibacter sp. AY1C7]PPG92915.1 metal ABC transporter substrate-binding protein [Rathayibacter sp. AY1F3]PPH18179.1 metal ABC transporter substrate-binding protein